MRWLRTYTVLLGREVESYFLAPLMYLVLAVFLVLNGIAFYYSVVDSIGNVNQTVRSFLGGSILFWINILVIPPLLTMRLLAEEKRTGSIEGLMTAPVTDVAVILAKFSGALLFYVALWLPSAIYLIMMKSFGALPDPGVLATSYLGVLLLGALLIAMGVLASAISPNQVVAAILGIVGNLMLFFVPLFSLQMSPGRLRASLEQISILFHFQNSFGKGVLDSGVLSVYVAGSALFLFFAVRVIESRRWS
jgi:ABC-2 type transport system permease protein